MELGHPPLSYGQSPKELVERERGREKKKNYKNNSSNFTI